MAKIGVIGLGLIGGSIFKDLKKLDYEVIGISNSQQGNNIFKNYDELKNCQIVFVCTAMNKTLDILDNLENILKPDTIVSDVCSLKAFVCSKIRPYKFIPSHPMAGTENKGFEYSREGLFKGASWVLTPFSKTDLDDINTLVDIIKKLGAKPIFTTPNKHDETAALISHMPLLIAQALFLSIKNNELALNMASSGFRDMTRLALSNEEMARDIFYMNHENIQNSILNLYKAVEELNSDNYSNLIKDIKIKRGLLFNK